MKHLFKIAFFLAFAVIVKGQELNPGIALVDGQRLTAAQLRQLVASAQILPPFYTDKLAVNAVALGDVLLVYSPASGTYHKISVNDFFTGTNIVLSVLGPAISPYIDPSLINYSNKLTAYSPTTPDLNDTNQASFEVFDVGGTNHFMAGSNLLTSVAQSLFTRPYIWRQVFFPFGLFGTNTFGLNAYGLTTNFPITALTVSNLPTVSVSDTIPYNSGLQGTNTTISIQALYNYFTNVGAIPTYTQARVQFNGNVQTYNITNDANTSTEIIHLQSGGPWIAGLIYAVSVITNGTQNLWAGIQTNTPYYLVPQATNVNFFHVYSNYTSAVNLTNFINITASGSGTLSRANFCPNYTAFNADATPVSVGNSLITGRYDVVFRTPTTTSNYYTSGSVLNSAASQAGWCISVENMITTNSIRIFTYDSGGAATLSRVETLISPE